LELLLVCSTAIERIKYHVLIGHSGSVAAAFQGWMYGGFTPAAGIFATLTSMAMLGILQPFIVLFSALVATGVALGVWAWGVGHEAIS
jgi:hypothetical protein